MKKEKTLSQIYKEEKNKDSLRKEAFEYFNDKYFKNPFENYFIFEQEERFLAKKMKFFIPGRVYTFQYNPHGIDILSYYDKRPLVYAMGEFTSSTTGFNLMQGVNLNFLPEMAKVSFLDTALNLFEKQYDEADKIADKGQLATMKEIGAMVSNWKFMSTNFDARAHIGLQFAVRNYDKNRIIKPVLIEMEDFPMIPYFVPKEFAGASPGQIYGMYIRAKEAIIKQSAISSKNEKRVQKNKSKFKKPGG